MRYMPSFVPCLSPALPYSLLFFGGVKKIAWCSESLRRLQRLLTIARPAAVGCLGIVSFMWHCPSWIASSMKAGMIQTISSLQSQRLWVPYQSGLHKVGYTSCSMANPALNLAPFGRWTLRDKAAQRRLALRWALAPPSIRRVLGRRPRFFGPSTGHRGACLR